MVPPHASRKAGLLPRSWLAESAQRLRILLQPPSAPHTRRDRDHEAVRIDHREVARSPGLILGLLGELATPLLDGRGALVDILPGDAVAPQPAPLLRVAASAEVGQPDKENHRPPREADADD